MALVYISVGSNVGDRTEALIRAIEALSVEAGEVRAVSSIYETEPWGFKAEQYFLNLVAELDTEYTARDLLGKMLDVEKEMGRERLASGYQSRIIDLDILLFGNDAISEAGLIIPHPRMQDRNFVLRPLSEVNPAAFHPVLSVDAAQMLESCTDKSRISVFMSREETEILLGVRKG